MSRIFFIFIIFFVSSCTTKNESIYFSSANNNHLEKTLSEYSDETICDKATIKISSNLTDWNTFDAKEFVFEARDKRGLACDVTPPSPPKRIIEDKTKNELSVNMAKRVAFLIGNSKYEYLPSLKNPINDVNKLEDTLIEYGFDVTKETNLNFDKLRTAIEKFLTKLNTNQDHEAILVYFAGHGLQNNGDNFLAPIDAKINSIDDIRYEMQNANSLFTMISESSENSIKIFLLDACRENIFSNSKINLPQINLSPNNIWDNSIMGFSTIQGQKSIDGNGKNSPYLESLTNTIINNPKIQIEEALKKTRIDVLKKTNNEQTPVEMSNLIESFSF